MDLERLLRLADGGRRPFFRDALQNGLAFASEVPYFLDWRIDRSLKSQDFSLIGGAAMSKSERQATVSIVTVIAFPVAAGVLILAMAAPWDIGVSLAFKYIGSLTGVGATSAAIGGLLGFLFGIPRRNSYNYHEADRFAYVGNTNLEQISDWLTKVIVGVSLVEARQIGESTWRLAGDLSTNLATTVQTGVVWAVGIYSCICGFAMLYVITRWQLPRILTHSERPQGEVATSDARFAEYRSKPLGAGPQEAGASSLESKRFAVTGNRT